MVDHQEPNLGPFAIHPSTIRQYTAIKIVYPDTKNPDSYQKPARDFAASNWRRDYSAVL